MTHEDFLENKGREKNLEFSDELAELCRKGLVQGFCKVLGAQLLRERDKAIDYFIKGDQTKPELKAQLKGIDTALAVINKALPTKE